MLAADDAALLIGDPALQIDRSRYYTWDLAEEWLRFTGKPFVFAFWAVRNRAAHASKLDLASIFQRSRDHGLEASESQADCRNLGAETQPAAADVHAYLTSNIFYYLDEPCLEGLRLFYQYAHECNALPPAPEPSFAAAPALI